MKKRTVIFILASLALALALSRQAGAGDFELDDKAVIQGMDGRSWYQGYTPRVQYGNASICLPIRSQTAVGSITVLLRLDDPNLLLFYSQPGAVTVSPWNGLYSVRLSVPLSQNRRNGDYPATILISGQNENGESLATEFPYVIRVRDGLPNSEALVPRLGLSGELRVGQESLLHLAITNPTTSLSMTDGELTMTDPSGEVLLSGSNRLEVPEILPGQTVHVELPVTVKGNAAVELHSLSLKLTYQVLGEEAAWEETITCPVSQEIRLERGEISVPSSVIQGELTTLSVPLMNMGKGDICNALVSLEIPELIGRQSVLVGTIEPGATGQAKLTFTPRKDALGPYSGTVTISCEDGYGNSRQWQAPVELTVEAAKPSASVQAEEREPTAPDWLPGVLGALCGILLAGFVFQGVFLRRKLHRLEEERL